MRRWFLSTLCCLVAALFVVPAFAVDNNATFTTGGTANWNATTTWSLSHVPTSSEDAVLTNTLATAGTVRVYTGSVAATTINFLRVGNDVANPSTNKVLIRNTFTSSFGAIINPQGIVEVQNTTLRFGIGSFTTFDNRGELRLGTNALLILQAGGAGSTVTNALKNAGTINFINDAGDTGISEINYGQTASFTNLSTGTIIKSGTGTASFTGEFGGRNRPFINSGTIIVNGGVMKFDTRDAFTTSFTNTSTGKIFIGLNSTAMVARTGAAWQGGDKISNVGSISLFGGTWAALDTDTGLLKVSATNLNTGVISGSGTVQWRLVNDTGTLLATGGVLRITSAIVGAGGTFAAGAAGTSGTLSFEGGNVGGGATLTGNVIATNSSAIVFAGDTSWTVNSAAQFGFAGATVAERGSLISSNASGASDTLFLNNASFRNNQGTLMVANGNGINYGQIGEHMTNNFVLTGVGTFTGNFSGANNAILNLGTISTVSGGLLAIDPRDALTFGGLQNGRTATATGTIVIANGGTLSIRRTDAAWFTYGTSPTNLGTINMQGGTLLASNTDSVAGGSPTDGGKYVNAAGGVINVTGTNNITNFRVIQNNGLLSLAANAHLTNTVNSSGTFDNSGGVIELNGTGSLQGGGANFFTVNGNYINNSTSAITNTAGGGILQFTGVTAVTNNGTISFLSGTGGTSGSGAGGNTNALILVGSSAANFFRNSGTLIFGTRSNAAARAFVISNQFANAGSFVVTNGAVLGAGGQVLVTIVGSTRATGGASTNEATGTIRMVNQATLGAAGTTISTSYLNGDLVNLGTITYSTVSNNTSFIALSEANAIFSNAASGHVIMEAGMIGAGDLSIRADRFVNAGTMVLSNSAGASGTAALNVQNAAAALTNLFNSGTILFGGGIVNAALFTNTATGLIQGNGTFSGTSTRVNVNQGTIRASGGTLFMANVTNSSLIEATPGSSLRLIDLNNGATGVLTSDTANVTIAGTTTNSGTMTYRNSSVGTFTGAARNEVGAVIRANTSSLIFMNSGVFTNLGTVGFTSSSGAFSGSVYNAGFWTLNPSTNNIAGNLTVAATGTRSLTGSVDIVGGSLSVEAGGLYEMLNSSSLSVAGVYSNAGSTTLRSSSVGTFTGAAVNTGTYQSDFSTDWFVGSLLNDTTGSMSFSNNSTWFVGGDMINNGTINVHSSSATFNGDVYDNGTWNQDPSTNFFNGNANFGGNRTLDNSVDIIRSNLNVTATGNYLLTNMSAVYVGRFTTNAGTITLRQNSLGVFSNTFVNSGSYLSDHSSNQFFGALNTTATGRMSFSNESRVTVSGVFTNAGIVKFLNSVGTFSSGVLNSGAWISDPSTNVFADIFQVTSSGSISMAAGAVYIFTNDADSVSSFLNRSTQSNTFDTIDGKFVFDATTLNTTQHFLTAGMNIGNLDTDGGTNTVVVPTLDIDQLAQYSNNFALGTLRIDSFFDVFTELTPDMGALFLTNLEVGSTGHLTISNNVQVYFITSNNFTYSQITLLGDGGLHQLVLEAAAAAIPEPNVALLWLCGAVTLYGARKRAKKLTKRS